MGEQENNEIKILIDALKYTSNIIVDLTNKLTLQEEKISQLENKFIKIQKILVENNLKLKTIDFDKLIKILSSDNINKINNTNNTNNTNTNTNINNNDDNDDDKISKYIIEKNNNNKQEHLTQSNVQNKLSNIIGDKTKIDKLIGSIVKRKNDLNQLINENKEKDKDIIAEYEYTKNNKPNNENSGIDFTIKTATNKSNLDVSKTNYEQSRIYDKEEEEENATNAHNKDLEKANNILKQIRRRANIKRM